VAQLEGVFPQIAARRYEAPRMMSAILNEQEVKPEMIGVAGHPVKEGGGRRARRERTFSKLPATSIAWFPSRRSEAMATQSLPTMAMTEPLRTRVRRESDVSTQANKARPGETGAGEGIDRPMPSVPLRALAMEAATVEKATDLRCTA
jgi:hypothetical protein